MSYLKYLNIFKLTYVVFIFSYFYIYSDAWKELFWEDLGRGFWRHSFPIYIFSSLTGVIIEKQWTFLSAARDSYYFSDCIIRLADFWDRFPS